LHSGAVAGRPARETTVLRRSRFPIPGRPGGKHGRRGPADGDREATSLEAGFSGTAERQTTVHLMNRAERKGASAPSRRTRRSSCSRRSGRSFSRPRIPRVPRAAGGRRGLSLGRYRHPQAAGTTPAWAGTAAFQAELVQRRCRRRDRRRGRKRSGSTRAMRAVTTTIPRRSRARSSIERARSDGGSRSSRRKGRHHGGVVVQDGFARDRGRTGDAVGRRASFGRRGTFRLNADADSRRIARPLFEGGPRHGSLRAIGGGTQIR